MHEQGGIGNRKPREELEKLLRLEARATIGVAPEVPGLIEKAMVVLVVGAEEVRTIELSPNGKVTRLRGRVTDQQ